MRLDRTARTAIRLTGCAVVLIVRDLGRHAGLTPLTRPHALGNQAITQALDSTGGDVRRSSGSSQHANPRTLMPYDDRRGDLGGDVARMVAGE